MAKHSVTAVFDTRADAEQAVSQLKSSGIPSADVTLLPAAGESGTYADLNEAKGKGFWGSLEQLFGGTDDQSTYAESIRRGGNMVSVRAEDDDMDRIIDILEKHGSVDLDERETAWRKEGWTGGAASGAQTTGLGSATASSRGLGMGDPGMTGMGGGEASRMGTMEAGALGVGAAALGTTGRETVLREERRDVATPVQPVPGVASTERAVMDRAVDTSIAAPTSGMTGATRGAADEVIQVVEERLAVGKRSVNRGKVRVHTSVVSREVSEDVTLRGETVQVDRRPVDRPVSGAALDVDPFRERTIEMEQYDEEAVVSKSAHVVEEIGIRKEATERVETIQDTVRSTKVDIDEGLGSVARFVQEIRGDMEVVGSDGGHVGIVDHMDGGRVKLKKMDSAAGGEHHYLAQDMIGSVADKVVLAMTAAEAKSRWTAV